MTNPNSAGNYNSANDFLNDAGFINYHFKLNTPDEIWWHNWIENNPDKTAIINEARGILNVLSFSIPDDEYNTELEKIKLAVSERVHSQKSKLLFRLPQKNRTVKWASVAAVLIFIISGIVLTSRVPSVNKLTDRFNNTTVDLIVKLEDDTKVTLSPGSGLKYQAFSSTERDVTLQGNASFEVTKNNKAPFRVFTGRIVAIVLGTTFDISKSDSSVIVDLKEGSLRVGVLNNGAITDQLLLEPHQSAIFANYQLLKVDRSARTDLTVNNERHDVEFIRNDFFQIAETIRKIYGVSLVNESGNNNWKFSGEFKNSTAQEIIESICLIKGLTSSVNGDTIVIR